MDVDLPTTIQRLETMIRPPYAAPKLPVDLGSTVRSGNGLVRVGFLGYGYWGPNILRSLYQHPCAELVKACDISPQNAARLRADYPSVAVTSEVLEVLEDPEIEAVCIATPADTHFELAQQALKCGKHVFVEKPLVNSPADAQDLIELAEQQSRTLMVGHVYQYNGPINLVKTYLENGYLGDIKFMCANRTSLGPRIRTDDHIVSDYAIHDIYLSTYLLGTAPRSVRATGYSCFRESSCDVIFIDLFFPENRLFHIHCSWYEPVKQRNITIVGTKRMLVYDDIQRENRLTVYHLGFERGSDRSKTTNNDLEVFDEAITVPHCDWPEPLRAEIDHFIRCVLDNTKPRSDGLDGKRTLEVIRAVHRSLGEGGVEVPVP